MSVSVSVCALTLPDSQCGGVDEEEEDVAEKALEHGRAGMVILGQVLTAQTYATYEQREHLTQRQGHHQLPGGRVKGRGGERREDEKRRDQ